jgi:hypothetical protein
MTTTTTTMMMMMIMTVRDYMRKGKTERDIGAKRYTARLLDWRLQSLYLPLPPSFFLLTWLLGNVCAAPHSILRRRPARSLALPGGIRQVSTRPARGACYSVEPGSLDRQSRALEHAARDDDGTDGDKADSVTRTELETMMRTNPTIRSDEHVPDDLSSQLACPRLVTERGKKACAAWMYLSFLDFVL